MVYQDGDNPPSYEHLEGDWGLFYKIAKYFVHKVKFLCLGVVRVDLVKSVFRLAAVFLELAYGSKKEANRALPWLLFSWVWRMSVTISAARRMRSSSGLILWREPLFPYRTARNKLLCNGSQDLIMHPDSRCAQQIEWCPSRYLGSGR